jgi:hypothetical protein
LTEEGFSSLLGRNPFSHLPRRVVPDVLGVTAIEISDPVVLVVLMKANDFSRNT